MINKTEINKIIQEHINNVFTTFIAEGLPNDPTRYSFLNTQQNGNLFIGSDYPALNTVHRFYVIYGISGFQILQSSKASQSGNYQFLLTVECVDKGDKTTNNRDDKTNYLSEIAYYLCETVLFNQTVDILTNKANDYIDTKLKNEYVFRHIETNNQGLFKFSNVWKDIYNFTINLQINKLIT